MNRRIRVNPITCEGHGVCAELLPERIELDEWGYPIVSSVPVDGELERHAKRAVDACPTLALLLEEGSNAEEDLQREHRGRSRRGPAISTKRPGGRSKRVRKKH